MAVWWRSATEHPSFASRVKDFRVQGEGGVSSRQLGNSGQAFWNDYSAKFENSLLNTSLYTFLVKVCAVTLFDLSIRYRVVVFVRAAFFDANE